MKDIIQIIITGLVTLLAAAIPLSLAYCIWSWAMTQVPVGLAYTGLIKLLVSILLFMVGGGLTIGMTILCAGFAAAIALAVCNAIFD